MYISVVNLIMANIIDITGKRFGRWTVLKRSPQDRPGATVWQCLCDCGTIKDKVLYTGLTSGGSSSCGCWRKEMLVKPMETVHSQRNPTYATWVSMKTRCLNKEHPTFKHYGARGIKVCPEWQSSFDKFLADMGNRPEGSSLDRIDNNGDYNKENCQWASKTTQAGNRRSNLRVMWDGEEYILNEVARMQNVEYQLLRARLLRGLSIEDAVKSLKDQGKGYRERAKARTR
jgi:hypothetical protein